MIQKLFPIFILLFLSFPLIYPFLQRGYFPTHDGEWAIVRLAEMHREVKGGQFPPRWAGYLNHGFGYPLFLFTYPFPYYLGETVHLVGFGLTSSIKLVFIFSIIGSAFTMYLLSREFWGKWSGILSAILYLYGPYRLANLYVRGSIGESLAFIFFPLLLYLFLKLSYKPSLKYFLITSISLTGFILTHNAMVVLFMPVLILWIIHIGFYQNKGRNHKQVVSALFMGILMASYFWLPAIVEKRFIILGQIPLANKGEHFVKLSELFSRSWNFGINPPLRIGGLHFILALVCTIFLFFKSKNSNERIRNILLVVLTGFTIFMLFPSSYMFWQLPLFKEIDFPWRILGVVMFLLSLIGGAAAKYIPSQVVTVGLIVLVIVLNVSYIKTEGRIYKPDDYYRTNDATTTSANELMPIWVQDKPTNRAVNIFKNQEFESIQVIENSDTFQIRVPTNSRAPLVINKLYFPGWTTQINDKKNEVMPEIGTGLITVSDLPQNQLIQLQFERTPIRWVADILSMSGLLLLGILWIYSRKYYR